MRQRRLMRVLATVLAVAGAAALAGAVVGCRARAAALGAWAVASGGAWGQAIEVAGRLNAAGTAGVDSVSCPSAGDCAAAGYYDDGSGDLRAFVIGERGGRWGPATEVAGRINAGKNAQVLSVSCPSPGNCAAGGTYLDRAGNQQAFVASESNGSWNPAIEVAGHVNAGGWAQVDSVSCASPGNCAAGGRYADLPGRSQAFVISEQRGSWGPVIEVAAAQNTADAGEVTSVSCPSPGNCAAAGTYFAGVRHGSSVDGHAQAFVISQAHGSWGPVIELAGDMNAGGYAQVDSVSCPSPGYCAAGGRYTDSFGRPLAFAADEAHGSWGPAMELAGALNAGGQAQVNSVSCASSGNCVAGGYSQDRAGRRQAFVISEQNGSWGQAIEIPGSGALNKNGDAEVLSVSCGSAGNCAAGGQYIDGAGHTQAFLASERNGEWSPAVEVASALNTRGNAQVTSVSCPHRGNCAAGGFFTHRLEHTQAFLVSQN